MSSENYLTLKDDTSVSKLPKYTDYHTRIAKTLFNIENINSQIKTTGVLNDDSKYPENLPLETELLEDIRFLDKMNFNVENLKDNNGYNVIVNNILNNKNEKNRIKLNNSYDKLNNAKRIKEINNYYDDKYVHQIDILKNICIIFLIILFICFLYKISFISEKIFIFLVGIGISIAIIYICKSILDILFRDNINYKELNFPFSKEVKEKKEEKAEEVQTHLQKDIDKDKDCD